MAYSGTVPWHGLGVQVGPDLSPDDMLKVAGLDWRVRQSPLYAEHNGVYSEVPYKFALQRETDGAVLSITTERYNPVQNADAMEFFDRFTRAGHMKMETAGSLDSGKFIWALARIDESFKLAGKDEVLPYLLLMQPHKVGKAMVIDLTATRVVCWNTLNAALGAGLRGSGKAFRMSHIQKFDSDMKALAEKALGLAVDQFGEYREAAEMLSKAKVANDNLLVEFFDNVISFDRAKAEREERKAPKVLDKFMNAWDSAPGQKLVSANGTWWGAVNAVTYVVDHHSGLTDDTRMRGAWIGEGAEFKRKAINLAVDYAQAA
jgi:phage/plasmid-like protein (TIGR03299 family)